MKFIECDWMVGKQQMLSRQAKIYTEETTIPNEIGNNLNYLQRVLDIRLFH